MLGNERQMRKIWGVWLFLLISMSFLLTNLARSQTVTTIVASNSGKCLDVPASTMQPGAQIIQYACHRQANQLWYLEPFHGAYRIVSMHSKQCLNVRGGDRRAGAAVIQWPCEGSSLNERWRMVPIRDGMRLIAVHSGLCLNVAGGATRDETGLIQWPCEGQSNELFLINQTSGYPLPTAPFGVPPPVVLPPPLVVLPPPITSPIEVIPESPHRRWHHWHEREWRSFRHP